MLYRKISSEIETHLTSGNDKILIIEAPTNWQIIHNT